MEFPDGTAMPLGDAFPTASFPTHEIHEVWDRRLLARDILLKLIESDANLAAASWDSDSKYLKGNHVVLAQRAVDCADALLAELAKAKEGA